mgnify:CR=1 FL=1
MNRTKDNDTKQGQGEIISMGGDILKNISDNSELQVDYVAICVYTLELLESILGKKYDFPVNIEKLVENIGLKITYQPLNTENDGKRIHRIAGKLIKRRNRITNEIVSSILIDEQATRKEQRYALAHELAHFLIHYDDAHFLSEFRVMPMLFKDMEEMVADVFAIFLLIPLPIFLKEFKTYIGVGGDVPIKRSEWLQYLSTIASVPYEDVAIGYQNIRYVSAIIYKISKNMELYKGYEDNQEFRKIITKQVKAVEDLFGDEEIKKLFC